MEKVKLTEQAHQLAIGQLEIEDYSEVMSPREATEKFQDSYTTLFNALLTVGKKAYNEYKEGNFDNPLDYATYEMGKHNMNGEHDVHAIGGMSKRGPIGMRPDASNNYGKKGDKSS